MTAGVVGEKPPVDYSVLTVEELQTLRDLAVKLEAGRRAKIEPPKE
jgi:hypothetical protein